MRGVAIGALVIAAAAAGVARADDGDAPADGLTWHGGDRCGSVTALRARIADHLGRPLAAADAIEAVVDVVRAPIEGDVRASLRIVTRRGEAAREVHGANCAAVVEAVAFVLSSAVTEGEVPPISPTVVADAAVPWLVRPVPVPQSLIAPPPRVTVEVAADGWSDAGTLPQLRLGAGGSLAVAYRRLRAELGAATWGRTWSPLDDASPATELSLMAASARGCGGVWRLWVCGGVLFGTMRGLDGPGDPPEKTWVAIAFQTRWQRRVAGPLGVAATVEGVGNVHRPQFSLGDGLGSHQPQPFALRLGLSAVVTVW